MLASFRFFEAGVGVVIEYGEFVSDRGSAAPAPAPADAAYCPVSRRGDGGPSAAAIVSDPVVGLL